MDEKETIEQIVQQLNKQGVYFSSSEVFGDDTLDVYVVPDSNAAITGVTLDRCPLRDFIFDIRELLLDFVLARKDAIPTAAKMFWQIVIGNRRVTKFRELCQSSLPVEAGLEQAGTAD